MKSTTAQSAREAEITASFASGPHRIIEVGTARVATYRFGRGPDVVCVHGWPLHGATFRRIIPFLADRFTLHVLDLPGTGATTCSEDTLFDFASHARVVRGVIDALGLSRYALLGHDSGGAIARIVAAGDPRVSAIVLGNTEIPDEHAWQVKLLKAFSKLPGKPLFRTMRIGAIRRSSLGFGGCFTDPRYGDGEFGALFFKPMLYSSEVAAGQMRLLEDLDFSVPDGLADAHARISAPILLIWGEDDRFFPLGKAREMLTALPPRSKLVTIPHAKLFAHEDHPEAFALHALEFLRLYAAEAGTELTA